MEISLNKLGTLVELAGGNYGTVHSAPELTLPDVPGELLVKLFHADTLERGEADRLREVVTWRAALPAKARATLDSVSAWPVRIVMDGRKAVGIVMLRAPSRFFFTFTPRSPNATPRSEPITIQSLFEPAVDARSRGISTPDDDDLLTRLVSCARLALFFRLLHEHGMVYGDLSQGNVLTSNEPGSPAIMVVDCDGAHAASSSRAYQQRGTKTWFSPEEEAKAPLDQLTDVYKLCIAILRILANSSHIFQITRASNLRGILDDVGIDFLSRGLSKNRADRSSADEIYRYLLAEINGRTVAPQIDRCEVSEPYLVVGASFDLVIDVQFATSITVTTPDRRRLDIPLSQASSTLRFSAVETGSYVVTASNTFGTVSAESHPVRVVRPPDLIAVHYPEPNIPSLNMGDLAVLRRGLEAAEATGAQLTSPFEQLERFSRQLEVYDGLFGPTQRIRDGVRMPDDLLPKTPAPYSTDEMLNPMNWPMAGQAEPRGRRFERLFRHSGDVRR